MLGGTRKRNELAYKIGFNKDFDLLYCCKFVMGLWGQLLRDERQRIMEFMGFGPLRVMEFMGFSPNFPPLTLTTL